MSIIVITVPNKYHKTLYVVFHVISNKLEKGNTKYKQLQRTIFAQLHFELHITQSFMHHQHHILCKNVQMKLQINTVQSFNKITILV